VKPHIVIRRWGDDYVAHLYADRRGAWRNALIGYSGLRPTFGAALRDLRYGLISRWGRRA